LIQVEVPEVDFPGGLCHFVATPIGNLGDISLRALAILAAAEIVYAEDTRHTRRLLDRYGIRVPMASYHDHNKAKVVPVIVSRLKDGDRVAVVSDAGMPCISDPGFTLVRSLLEEDLPWTVIPGPSSTVAALVLAGFSPDRFLYLGYAPRKKGQRRKFLADALTEPGTVLIFESCHRIRSTLEILAELAPDRILAVVREITKIHEESLRGNAGQLLDIMTGRRLKGELVMVLQGLGGRRLAAAGKTGEQ
jgi:16S rRNA (cytidine1402-2'-O)-methyltransferase